MFKISKKKHLIKDKNLANTFQIKKSGSIVSKSKQSKIKNLKQNFLNFPSVTPNKKTSLQVKTINKIENPQRFLFIIAKIGYYKKKQINKFLLVLKFETSNNKKYKLKTI